jgi:hypothetical protein
LDSSSFFTKMSVNLDINDFVKYAPIAKKLSNKKGFLKEIKIGIENPISFYYCLFGNILYCFENENDINSLLTIYFLEGSTCKISTSSDSSVLAITLVGGKKITFGTTTAASGGKSQSELQEWMDSIEGNKFLHLSRKLDDYESSLLSLQHKTEQNELVHDEYEKSISDLQRTVKELTTQTQQQENSITTLTREKQELTKRLKETETDRLLLLKSRGITPKTLPLWALQNSSPRKGGTIEPLTKLKLWVGSWNLSGKEPFINIPTSKATSFLLPFIPSGYDIYVLGIQECINENLFEIIDTLLNAEGCRRLRLELPRLPSYNSSNNMEEGTAASAASSDPTRLTSKSDGRFNTIVIYIRYTLFSDVKLVSLTSHSLVAGTTIGAIASVLSINGRNIVFVNSQFDSKSNETRREQYQMLTMNLGSSLAENGYHLNEQFHHIVWFGDLGYRLVDTSGNEMPCETALNMLSDPRCIRTLFESHDQLNQEKKLHNIFYGYREPVPFPNFYPSFRKIENRPPVNYSRSDWAKNTYRTIKKDSFFKGGKTKEYPPSFTDRILFYSMNDLVEDLLPESQLSEMYILKDNNGNTATGTVGGNTSVSSSRHVSQEGSSSLTPPTSGRNLNPSISPMKSGTSGGGGNTTVPESNSYLTTVDDSAKLSVQVDNYRSVNDGEGMTASSHSPVFCTFLLRIRHDHSHLIEAKAKMVAVNGDINDVLSALASNDNSYQTESSLSKSPAKKSYILDVPTSSSAAISSLSNANNTDLFKTPPRGEKGGLETTPTSSSLSLAIKQSAAQEKQESDNQVVVVPYSAYSLLPHGIYHVRISEMKLIWGVNEEYPVNVQILFPAPFEVSHLFKLLSWRFFILSPLCYLC